MISGVAAAVAEDELLATALAHPGAAVRIVAPDSSHPVLATLLANRSKGVVLVITPTGREAEDLAAALGSFIAPQRIGLLPSWETLPHERLSPSPDVVGRRVAVLRRLKNPDAADASAGPLDIVVAPVRSLLQPIVSGASDLTPVRLRTGDTADLEELVAALVLSGYSRVELVERRGDLAVRGGILDVFPPAEEHPVRVEFWGDTVEEIRSFSVADQRSLALVDNGLWAPPVRELPLTSSVRERAAALIATHPDIADMLTAISEGRSVPGMEALAPLLSEGMETLLDLLPAQSSVLICDPERVQTRAHELVRTSEEFLEASWHNATAGNVAPIDLSAAAYKEVSDLEAHAITLSIPWWTVSPFGSDSPDECVLDMDPADSYRGDTEKAFSDMRSWVAAGWKVVVLTEGHGPAERLTESLRAEDVPATLVDDVQDVPGQGLVHVSTARLEHGFILNSTQLAVLTETDLVGQKSSTKDMRKMPSKRRSAIDPLTLKPGDYVVHEQHGVGKYVEMVQRTVGTATREYIVLEYASSKRGQPADRLFVPSDQLDQVTRYVGGEAPSVHRLGGSDWQKSKARARKAVREIAGELVRLYAARTSAPGRAFGPDTPWQAELEDAFPYVETADQLSCISEVKADMEKSIPMDRLICGDVGYGKTEIAVRAAFKAVQEGTQVAVLVPTTLLVQQHLSTFAERYASFPVKVASLSRFQTDKESEEVKLGIADGSVDVVIGTHRLLTSGVRFKDLGLVIVDEEQRFGVEHKEHLKALRTNVDVLTMSATPIPRTLEMAVTGIREMSMIQTPPEERLPVLTFVGPYDERQVSAAMRRELLREGQVFFVHNRVESIDRVASKLRELVPEARVAVAHGQMGEHQLEAVIVDFWEKNIDVLVCTTIVESGIDIPNANTLIVDRADRFGLSQLHQLRGRVGRGRERAYAYFMYAPEKPLTELAYDRLSTIAQYTDLGAGMQIALKDLEIRGAGNLLGGEQSGHIAEVGFDLYVRLVGEALAEYKGEAEAERKDVRVELPIDAHVPHDYVKEERLRLQIYRALADAVDDPAIDAVVEEMFDRFGAPPQPVLTLVDVARFKVLARKAGIEEVILAGSSIRLAPVELPESRQMRLDRMYPRTITKPATRTILVPRPTSGGVAGKPLVNSELLSWVIELIQSVIIG